MRTDEEIRQDVLLRPLGSPIGGEGFPCEEQRVSWHHVVAEPSGLDEGIEPFLLAISNGELGIDTVIDENIALKRGGFQLRYGPFSEILIIRHNIKKDIRVDEDHPSPRVSAMIASVLSSVRALSLIHI